MSPQVLIDGRYRLDALIGSGGFAQVYAATDEARDCEVAIKLMRPRWRGDPRVSGQFVNEAHALRRLTHAPIAQLRDEGITDDERRYLVLDRIDGALFGELLEVERSLGQLLAAFHGLLAAVVIIHRRGVVHGDLKANNVILTTAQTAVTLVDFGLARTLLERRELDAGDAVWEVGGTPELMAPELARSPTRTTASEVYALGAMLYELLTGAPPFVGGTSAELTARHEGERVAPPSQRAQMAVPPALDAIVLRALAKRPADRYPSVATFRADLTAIGATAEALAARRPPHATGAAMTWRHGKPVLDTDVTVTRD